MFPVGQGHFKCCVGVRVLRYPSTRYQYLLTLRLYSRNGRGEVQEVDKA